MAKPMKTSKSASTRPAATSYSAKPRGARESGQPRPATASVDQPGGPRKSNGGAVKSSTASGGVKPSATSCAGSRTQSGAKSQPAPLPRETVAEVKRKTQGQGRNPEWNKWRENRITASIALEIANSKFVNGQTSEVPQLYLKAVVGSGSGVQTPAMNWGVRNEKKAVQAYEALQSSTAKKPVKVKNCGLFVDKDKPWLAARPDGIVQDAKTGKDLRLLEVKCRYKHRNKTVAEACRDDTFCLENVGSSYSLKKTHSYYTQVQCQMKVSGLKKTDFVVHTKKETPAIAPVKFDRVSWKQTAPKLEMFYTNAVVRYQ